VSAAFEGDLERFSPSEVLQFLGLTAASGRLVLERPGERAEIGFERGRPIAACTSGRAVRTGDVLVHRGAIDRARLARALDEQRMLPGERLGALLVRERAVLPEQVSRAVEEVIRRILYGITAWRRGRFSFHPEEAPAASDLDLRLDLDRVILEGLSQVDLARAGTR
jgi:hypothetical protein